jgi:YebC/PmpR family DNA-binding regulatory protein
MSGHSKWHNIQDRKGKQDAVRSGQFTKVAKLVAVAARSGGDPATNFSLRLALEKAKEVGMPKDNIERAIKRGAGDLNEGAQIEELIYEGYGPGGVAVLVKVLTDNKNRTVSDIKHLFSEAGGTMGSAGSVMWMFGQWGIITVKKEDLKSDKDEFELKMIDAGAEDISDSDGQLEIKTKMENFQKVLAAVKEMGIEPLESGLQWVSKDKVPVSDDVRGKLEKLFGNFEDNDDVSDYFTNAE